MNHFHDLWRNRIGLGSSWLVVLLLCIVASPSLAQDDVAPVDLRAKQIEGSVTTYEYWAKRNIQVLVQAGGEQREAATSIESKGRIRWEVERVNPDGSAQVIMTYEWITLDLTNPQGEKKNVDSRKSVSDLPMAYNLLTSIAGQPITVHLDANGEVTRIDGLNAIKSKLDNPDMLPEEREFAENARSLTGLVNAPDNATSGSTWTEQFDAKHQTGTMSYDTTWQLDQVEQLEGIPVASITGKSRLELEVDRSDLPPDAPPVDVRLTNASSEAQVWFDLDRGQLVGSNVVTETTITLSVNMGARSLNQITTERDQDQVWRVETTAPASAE